VIVRSPVDVLRLVVAGLALLVTLVVRQLFGDTLVTFAAQLLAGIAAVPAWIIDTLVIGTRLIALAVLIGLVATLARRGLRALVTVALGVALGALVALVAARWGDTPEAGAVVSATVDLAVLTASTTPTAVGIAVLAAALTAAAPWLGRRWRRLGWLAMVGLVWTRFITSPMSFDSLVAWLAGWVAGAAALVILGGPTRRPTVAAIERSLADVALPVGDLAPAAVDARGSTPFFGTAPQGQRLFVKVLGADQRSADLLFRAYRSLWRSDLGDERPFSSLRRGVEHEAFVALAARDLGLRTPRLRALGTAEPNGFVLAYEVIDGRSLDRVPPDELTDDVLASAWQQLALLRAHRVAHRDLRLANLFLAADGDVWIIDFGFSEMAASDLLLATDVAEFVASSSIVVGAARATSPARATVDGATLAAAGHRLRPRLLTGATRAAMKERAGLLDELRHQLAIR
jgi:hypothetical protein